MKSKNKALLISLMNVFAANDGNSYEIESAGKMRKQKKCSLSRAQNNARKKSKQQKKSRRKNR